MSGAALTLFIILAVVVVGAFVAVWRLDARRATDVANDEERLDVDPDIAPEPIDSAHPETQPDADPEDRPGFRVE